MSTYRINVSALKRMAAIEFSHHCNRVRHPELGGPIMERLGLGAVAQQAAKEHSISAARAMDFIMTAWQAEGQSVINRWDARAIATLTDAVPTALPNKYRQAAIRSIEQDNGGEWVVCYDSDRPRQTPDRAPKDGFELIVYTQGTATLEARLMERIAPMAAEHKAHLANPVTESGWRTSVGSMVVAADQVTTIAQWRERQAQHHQDEEPPLEVPAP